MEEFRYVEGKKLRYGYTTGTCSAAAAKAATEMLLSGEERRQVEIDTPKGKQLSLEVLDIERKKEEVSCAIRKDAGDDCDVTDGMLIYAKVRKVARGFRMDGGVGIGRVTKAGLDQPIGNAAINRVPRKMILDSLMTVAEEYHYDGGLEAVIYAPDGVEIAKRTFNPKLGIEGGISILGTSGIVEPMSEQALVDTIRAEISMKVANGKKALLFAPGNYGEEFIRDSLGLELDDSVKCSNFIGDSIELAAEYGIQEFLLIGHIGKLVKLALGIMNTHSKMADGRLEALATAALQAGAEKEVALTLLQKNTTEDALEYLQKTAYLDASLAIIMEKIQRVLNDHAMGRMRIGAVVFSKQTGICKKTSEAERMLTDGTFCRSRTGSEGFNHS